MASDIKNVTCHVATADEAKKQVREAGFSGAALDTILTMIDSATPSSGGEYSIVVAARMVTKPNKRVNFQVEVSSLDPLASAPK